MPRICRLPRGLIADQRGQDGYTGRVAIVDGGHNYTITLTKLSNGTSTITAVDTGDLSLNNGSSSATYGPPEIRENGGKWHQES